MYLGLAWQRFTTNFQLLPRLETVPLWACAEGDWAVFFCFPLFQKYKKAPLNP